MISKLDCPFLLHKCVCGVTMIPSVFVCSDKNVQAEKASVIDLRVRLITSRSSKPEEHKDAANTSGDNGNTSGQQNGGDPKQIWGNGRRSCLVLSFRMDKRLEHLEAWRTQPSQRIVASGGIESVITAERLLWPVFCSTLVVSDSDVVVHLRMITRNLVEPRIEESHRWHSMVQSFVVEQCDHGSQKWGRGTCTMDWDSLASKDNNVIVCQNGHVRIGTSCAVEQIRRWELRTVLEKVRDRIALVIGLRKVVAEATPS